MDWDDASPLFALAALAGFVIALRATAAARELRLRLAGLTERFTVLDRRVVLLGERLDRLAPSEEPAPQSAPAAEPAVAPEQPAVVLTPQPVEMPVAIPQQLAPAG